MRFIYESNLEQELQEQNKTISDLTEELIDMFDEVGFERRVTINGINFSIKKYDVYASFYVDSKLNYKGYVTKDSENSFNYQVKGNIDNVIDAADSLIDTFYENM